jgi:hypothetical protein
MNTEFHYDVFLSYNQDTIAVRFGRQLEVENCDFKFWPWRAPEAALRLYRTRRHHGRQRSEQSAGRADERLI